MNSPHRSKRQGKLGGSVFVCLLAFCVADCFANQRDEQTNQTDLARTNRTVKRGLTAKFQFSHSSSTLRALADQSIDAPVLVRLEKEFVSPQSSGGPNSANHRYTLWFFGAVTGDYNLADFVVQKDGSALTATEDLSSMNVTVVSELPPGHGTSLYEIEDPSLRIRGGYRATLFALGLLWFAVPIVWSIQRWRNQTAVVVEHLDPPPTLADRMRPLVQRAYAGTLSVEEQSRLELMLYKFWQRRVGLPDSISSALPVLRQHAEAGELLRIFEAWVHAPENSRPSFDSDTLDQLLVPYRTAEANELALQDARPRNHDALMESAS